MSGPELIEWLKLECIKLKDAAGQVVAGGGRT